MDMDVDMVGQGMKCWHGCFPQGGGSATLSVTGNVPVK
jgi:hypothetical protein